jgi:RND family efflux transporter MFP subunit
MVEDRSLVGAMRGTLAIMALLLLAGCDAAEDGSAKADAPPPPPEVTVSKPLVQRLTEWDEFTGRFEPIQQVEIRARVAGYLQEIGFEDGAVVEAGQTLFVIDPRPYQAAVDRAKAQIDMQRAQLTLATLDQERTSRLVTTSAAARATLDDRNAQLAEASASLAGSEAELRQAELDLGFTRVTAPFAGRVSDRRVDVGNLVSDQTLLTTIVQLDPIYLSFDMSESDFLAYQRAEARW